MSSERILVVDDSAEVRDFLANTVLGLEGYVVDVAVNGKDGLAAILADPPDLVITDHAMPGLTGLEMVQTVREAGLHTPIILMTAEGSEELASHALRAGVSYYFIKPFDAMELQEAVETILRPSSAEPAPKEEVVITGDQALSILKDHTSDIKLVFLDLALPHFDGYQVAAAIMGSDQWSKIPIVVVTAHSEPWVLKNLRELGVTEVIAKPFHPKRLRDALVAHGILD